MRTDIGVGVLETKRKENSQGKYSFGERLESVVYSQGFSDFTRKSFCSPRRQISRFGMKTPMSIHVAW